MTDVSLEAGGGPVPAGYQRLRLNKPTTYEWSYLNIAIELRVEVLDKSLEGRSFPLSRIRAYSGPSGQVRSDNWQALTISVKALLPVSTLPKRLHTAFCWAQPDQFADDAARGLSSVGTWKALGFNTVNLHYMCLCVPHVSTYRMFIIMYVRCQAMEQASQLHPGHLVVTTQRGC